ncbi:carbonic anhydrase 1-like [Anthonomus grandis grandis]|uniref:carbonic anhydrase 1-like n=1 Tax=Anthonomus grandis grandis TaxID=2921223 RepID=UPI002165B042|nr:carbonic anhydrase 1-like [Anthonomus grandis grandis]
MGIVTLKFHSDQRLRSQVFPEGCFSVEMVFLVFLLIAVQTGVHSQDFGYEGKDGPQYWGNTYSQCVGKHQSPINILTRLTKIKKFPRLEFEHFDKPLGDVNIQNNGHTVLLKPIGAKTDLPTIKGGPLKGLYRFQQLHFHWGANDSIGSENKINSLSFPLELHVVMYNTEYGLEKASVTEKGLVVLSFLYRSFYNSNKNYETLINSLKNVTVYLSNVSLVHFPPLDQLVTTKRAEYFTYEGSLTTPPCSEVVTWIEFVHTIPLSSKQLAEFRHLTSRNGLLEHNYRPIQPLNNRIIYFNSAAKNPIKTWISLVLILLFLNS